jgi:dehydrogenase/reductase SDR family member 7B
MNMQNKVVWITGASSGIGEALAYQFSKEGASVILSARRAEELQRVKNACTNPEKAAVLPLDLSLVDSLEAKTHEAVKIFGKVDILINNGGISQRAVASKTDLSVDRKIMEVNFFSQIAITKAILPYFEKQKSGHIVVTSSILGKIGVDLRSAYCASKHAIQGFFDALREEVHKDNINVLLVCPGYIKTNVSFHALTETGEKLNIMADGQAKGMEPEVCAQKIIKAIKSNKTEIYIGGREIIGVYLKRYVPNLYLTILRKFGNK